eukprot:TRINITY_DN8171_c0_g1_i1.p1 TRINITY_DN8171_c0_g1~~TRINITY_DN8171_c0_g1_i1.p1  ORF type:complete len:358 (+),score=53.64 TRINITY_DN8171_c0_g1_i1:70-1143(+)
MKGILGLFFLFSAVYGLTTIQQNTVVCEDVSYHPKFGCEGLARMLPCEEIMSQLQENGIPYCAVTCGYCEEGADITIESPDSQSSQPVTDVDVKDVQNVITSTIIQAPIPEEEQQQPRQQLQQQQQQQQQYQQQSSLQHQYRQTLSNCLTTVGAEVIGNSPTSFQEDMLSQAHQGSAASSEVLAQANLQQQLQLAALSMQQMDDAKWNTLVKIDNKMVQKVEERRTKRMQSNRESARRSRKRKQEHLQHLECEIEVFRQIKEKCEKEMLELQQKYNDLNENYNHLKMENIQLKDQLEKLIDDVYVSPEGEDKDTNERVFNTKRFKIIVKTEPECEVRDEATNQCLDDSSVTTPGGQV